MLSVIISIFFFGAMTGEIFIYIYRYKLLMQLEEDSGIRITRTSQFAARRDLREIVNSNVDNSLKIISKKIIGLLNLFNWLFFGAIGLIIIIFILNAILG